MTDVIRTAAPPSDCRPNVGIMLINQAGFAWVGRRIDAPAAWQMPQGGIDPGETAREAALRELAEETGVTETEIIAESSGWLVYDFPPEVRARTHKGRWRGQAQRWFAIRFTGDDRDVRIAGDHAEFDAWRWVARDELPGLIVPFKRPVYEAVVAEFEDKLKGLGY